MNSETTLVVQEEQQQSPSQSLILRPAGEISDIVESWKKYQELKSKLLDSTDWQEIAGKRFIKKSGWRKLSTAFAISDAVVKEERKEFDGYFSYEITVKSTAVNGRYSFGIGSCSSNERRFVHPEHDVRTTAHTRAKNRAISDLIGGGEISAEEIVYEAKEMNNRETEQSAREQRQWAETLVGPQRSEQDNEQYNSVLTDRQRKYIVSLLNSRVIDNDERELRLEQIEGLSKEEASEWIQELCSA